MGIIRKAVTFVYMLWKPLFFLHHLLSICTLAKKINEVHNFLRPLWEPVFQHRLLTFLSRPCTKGNTTEASEVDRVFNYARNMEP